jgi:polysaccharide biosynthesis protein PslF
MKVAFITPRWPPTPCGVGDYTLNLSQALKEKGVSVTVLTRQVPLLERHDGIDVLAVSKSWRTLGVMRFLNKLKSIKPDILHLQYEGFGYNQSYTLPAFWRLYGGPKVLTLHEVWFKNFVHRWRDKILQRGADQVIVNDQGCLERYHQLGVDIPVEKVGVGANVPLLNEPNSPPQDILRVGYFGFFNRIKTVDLLMEAVSDLKRKDNVNLELLMIGNFEPERRKEHRELKILADQLGIQSRMKFTGFVSATDAAKLLKTCHIAVLPYIDGASPRRGSLQACLGLGVPTITTRSRYLEASLRDGENVLYLPNLSRQDLRQTIARLASDKALQSKLSTGGREFSREFTWSAIADKHIHLYEKIMAAR